MTAQRRRRAPALLAAALLIAGCSGPAPTGAGSAAAGASESDGVSKGVTDMNAISLQFAGYRNDPEELSHRVDLLLDEAKPAEAGRAPIGLVVPHAGYVYSGSTAAAAYRAVRGMEYDTVLVMGPSHREAFRGFSILDSHSFRSPLGEIPTDRGLAEKLLDAHPQISYRPAAHANEHSLEVQIPFLQRSLRDFQLVMAVIGAPEPDAERAFVEVVTEAAKEKKVLLVASSDLSHYHDYNLANKMDRLALRSILALDQDSLLRDVQGRKCEACGLGPVLTLLRAARILGADEGVLLRQLNSGDTAGSKDQVVGYAAVAFYPGSEDGGNGTGEAALSTASRRELLRIARDSIEDTVLKGRREKPVTDNDSIKTPQGAFVTITIGGKLRGCIGNFGIRDPKPLYQTVSEMAAAAAVRDPRFKPLSENELGEIDIEISALSPLRPVSDVNEIEVGRHGLYITKGYNSGVLLPQVATEYGWDRTAFLEQTCRKAGMGPNEWKEDAKISVFEAEVFGEKE